MSKTGKRLFSIALSLLLIIGCFPIASFASETGTLTVSTSTTSEGVDIDDDVAFTYEVKINDVLFNGSARGSDGDTYAVVDGALTIPCGISATIENIPAGSSYEVKRLGYDNEKYALVDESSAITGKVAENTYFKTVNDGEATVISAEEFNSETDNGTNLQFTVYKDVDGVVYDPADIEYRGGYTSPSNTTSGNYAHDKNSVELFTIHADVTYGNVTTSGSFVKKNTATATYSLSADGFEPASGSVTGTSYTGKDDARDDAAASLGVALTDYAKSCFDSITASHPDKKVVYDTLAKLVARKTAYLFGNFSWADGGGDGTSAEADVQIAAFRLTEDITNYVYTVDEGEPDKTAAFEVTLTPAPTGTFQINFALDDAIPTGCENAIFEIKDANGNVLVEGTDYTLEKSPYSLSDITKGILEWGITIYKFSGIKFGDYTLTQKKTENGYKIDTAEYSFSVSRTDGSVTGDMCSTSAINSSTPCIYNADKSINILVTKVKLYLFMNESFTLQFNVHDQNGEPVEGAEFMMVERAALLELIGQLAKLGVSVIGDIDIATLLQQITDMDFSNIDTETIIALLQTILEVLPSIPEGTKLTVPAILMAASNAEGVVKFNNASNITNVLDTIAKLGDDVDPEQLAETIKNLVGSAIPEEYLNILVELAKYIGLLNIHTGIPSRKYVLSQVSAPDGYERNALMYTMEVTIDGNATTNAGILTPPLADLINDKLGFDVYDLLVNEEEFNNASGWVKDKFGDFDDYMNFVIDIVISQLDDELTQEQVEEFRQNVNRYYDEYDNLAEALNAAIQDFNETAQGDLQQDWSYKNHRYFLDVPTSAVDCHGTVLAPVSIVDADGNNWEVNDGVAVLPYGTYTFSADIPDGYVPTAASSDTTLVINDHNAEYAVTLESHQEVTIPAVTPSCTETGLTEGTKCAVCGEIIVAQETVDALGHGESTDWIIDAEPTYHTDGSMHKECTVCGETVETETIPALVPAGTVKDCDYTPAKDTHNTFTVKVQGRASFVQFVEFSHGNGTRSYDRFSQYVTIVSYDEENNEVDDRNRDVAYEIWTIYTNLNVGEVGVRCKYGKVWEDLDETYNINYEIVPADAAVISAELAATSGSKTGPVPATIVTEPDAVAVQLRMDDGSTCTYFADKATVNEDGNLVFTGKAWANHEGECVITIRILAQNKWVEAGTLTYTVIPE